MSAQADRLRRYREKRDFARTPEPGPGAAPAEGRGFVVQMHAARRLHWDFRLEWAGVLLSWAVTRGPSGKPGEKRLAVRTEDHPVDYAGFEGVIPKGEYGGGAVMLWDRGTWEPLDDDPAEGLARGKLRFRLHGARMQGVWKLVRMRDKGEKRENWLLLKERDEAAGDDPERLVRENQTSVTTGRTLEEIREGAPAKTAPQPKPRAKRRTAPGPLPPFTAPQLATLVDEAPEGEGWQHETKFDGYRCLLALGKGGPRFYTRSGKDWSDRFGDLAPAAAQIACRSALIDGEVMARHAAGSPFSALQAALTEGRPLVLYAFDLLHLDGTDLTAKPLTERRAALEKLLSHTDPEGAIRLTDHVRGRGPEVYAAACAAGAEGIVSKRLDAPYRGGRGKSWLKVKCLNRREFVIGGYTPSDKPGRAFASLLLGEYQGGRLVYRGRVGTGFRMRDREALMAEMKPRKTPPFAEPPPGAGKDAVWVRPELVAETTYTEMTPDGVLRHPSFLGLRRDKAAAEVGEPAPEPETGGVMVAGVRISNPARRIASGLNKQKLAEYYARVGARMVEINGRRPLSLLRCPAGIEGECFYQKHPGPGFDEVPRVAVEESDGLADYLYISRPEHLLHIVQMGGLELHARLSANDRPERPDRLVFDLDPDEGMDWARVRAAAQEIRERLADLGLEAGAMVTGGKGVHVWVPLRRVAEWRSVKLFARTFAAVMAARAPDRYTAELSKRRRKGRIFIDWLRNDPSATAVAPYSARARPGAPAAVPVTWEALDDLPGPNVFRVAEAERWMPEPCPWLAQAARRSAVTAATAERLAGMAQG